MTGISRLLLRGKSFVLGSFHFSMTHPPRGPVSSIHLCTTGLLRKSAEPHITEKCVTCKQQAFEDYERCAAVFATRVRVYEPALSLPGVSSYSMSSHIKVSIIHHFLPHLQLWMETDDREIAPCLTNGRMAQLHGLPTSKLLLLKERTGTNRLPLLQLLSALISQRGCSQLHGRGMEKHQLV